MTVCFCKRAVSEFSLSYDLKTAKQNKQENLGYLFEISPGEDFPVERSAHPLLTGAILGTPKSYGWDLPMPQKPFLGEKNSTWSNEDWRRGKLKGKPH